MTPQTPQGGGMAGGGAARHRSHDRVHCRYPRLPWEGPASDAGLPGRWALPSRTGNGGTIGQSAVARVLHNLPRVKSASHDLHDARRERGVESQSSLGYAELRRPPRHVHEDALKQYEAPRL
jgi:hypothetical protein